MDIETTNAAPAVDLNEAMVAPIGAEQLKKFTQVLEKMGIEAFGEKGDLFDPNIHNAIMHEEDPEQDESILGEVFQRGYRRGDKIIRCAMVKVIN
jgi:molecular chaperone GrpE